MPARAFHASFVSPNTARLVAPDYTSIMTESLQLRRVQVKNGNKYRRHDALNVITNLSVWTSYTKLAVTCTDWL